jgi:hypothetical protein
VALSCRQRRGAVPLALIFLPCVHHESSQLSYVKKITTKSLVEAPTWYDICATKDYSQACWKVTNLQAAGSHQKPICHPLAIMPR